MDRKTFTIVLSIILIAAFFLPYLGKAPNTITGYEFVFNAGDAGSWENYLWLIIPIAGLLLLLGALNNERYILGRNLLAWLALLMLLYIVVRPAIEGKDVKMLVKSMGYGYWISLAAALFLAFARTRR